MQPLVENSIYHGIKYLRGPGNISISVYKEGDYIITEIKDNGVGIPEAQLKEIRERMEDNNIYKQDGASFGILNVYQRIKLYYENDSDMTIETKDNEGTKIVLKLNSNAYKSGQTGENLMYKVIIVDDEFRTKERLLNLTNWADTQFNFCGEASDGEMALSLINELKPDIVIMDIEMPF